MSTECVKNNTSASSSSVSDLYERHALYAPEDILNVCKAEDAEQLRRLADVEGENHKRVLANNWSELYGDSLRSTWFGRGSSFVLSLLGSVRSAVVHTASDISTTVSNKAGDLGHKAAVNIQNKAGEVGVIAQAAAHDASNTISIKAGEVGLRAQEKAHQLSDTIAQKAGETASSVSLQAQAAALNLKGKSLERAHSVSSLAQEKALDLKAKGLETVHNAGSWFSGKTSEYSQKLKDAVTSMVLYKKLGNLTGRTNLTFALLEEETERAYRMNSSLEIYRIENALKVSALIKALHPALYRPTSEPNVNFATRLLEEAERSRRMFEDKTDKAAITNGKAVSGLISQKFSAGGEQFAFKKTEVKTAPVVDLQFNAPATAAM